MNRNQLEETARAMVAPGKGILAADESLGTIEKRFNKINLPNTEENRQAYREMLFTTKGIGESISGVILFDETIRQKTQSGVPFVEVLTKAGVIPGIKDPKKVLNAEELAKGDMLTFTATGVIDGPLLPGVEFTDHKIITHSVVMRASSGTIRYITTHHHQTSSKQ